ncbi:outer membrane beta-barrel protein [Microbulbifer sediminum]|uniref:outer membrane beta-barrel protein n=1 Tax=Microbulbifer sediminum TaxID=2904250 RepID=UPI001F2D32F1|nr:outer membrane beta-barrel protein [Microbulbifer sediminum]
MRKNILFSAMLSCAFSTAAAAEGIYVSGNIGYNDLDDINTAGSFSSDFTTGAGTSIPAGTPLPAGTGVSWDTSVDSGTAVSFAVGYGVDQWRFEAEYSTASNDVDSHGSVSAAGIPLDGEDAAVLISGQQENLGVTVGDLVAAGEGEISADYLFVNAYYDFDMGSALTPYVGAGIGNAMVDVDYSPSGVSIIDDDDSVLAYQFMGGVNLALSDQLELFGGLRWRQTDDLSVGASLFPAGFELEADTFLAEVGTRWQF